MWWRFAGGEVAAKLRYLNCNPFAGCGGAALPCRPEASWLHTGAVISSLLIKLKSQRSSRPWLHSHLVPGTKAPQSSRPLLHSHLFTGIKPSRSMVISSLAPQSSRPWLHSHLVLGTIAPQSSRPWLHGHIVTIHQTSPIPKE